MALNHPTSISHDAGSFRKLLIQLEARSGVEPD